MERIQKIIHADAIPMPDPALWYSISVALFLFVIWAVKRHIDSTKDTSDKHGDLIAQMGKCIIELTTMTKLHELRIESLEKAVDKQGDDLEALRDFYIVSKK